MIKSMDASLTQGLVTLAAIVGFSGLSALMMLGLFKLTQRRPKNTKRATRNA